MASNSGLVTSRTTCPSRRDGPLDVDRWEPDRNADLFPELEGASFPRPDIVANLDVDRLVAIDAQSVDYVIASHVLEHLAEPLGLLEEIDRVLKPGGLLLILLPDRRRTFDSKRPATSLDELIGKHVSERTTVTNDEIAAFIETANPDDYERLKESSAEERDQIFDLHRLRSIHVHCWTEQEFATSSVHATPRTSDTAGSSSTASSPRRKAKPESSSATCCVNSPVRTTE